MTSYHIVAPVFLVRFQGSSDVVFHAWSPRRYGPAYTYDIVIESEDNQHPSMNIEYVEALQRVMSVVEEMDTHPFVDLTTDYHCPVPLDERGDRLYVVTLGDSPFSPVFFLREDAELYLTYLSETFVRQQGGFRIREVTHSLV
jgi:hypothetical protein